MSGDASKELLGKSGAQREQELDDEDEPDDWYADFVENCS